MTVSRAPQLAMISATFLYALHPIVGTMPTPSLMETNWFDSTLEKLCQPPFGHLTFISALVAEPSPKCNRGSLQERKLDWLWISCVCV